jgi:hypothetical protein
MGQYVEGQADMGRVIQWERRDEPEPVHRRNPTPGRMQALLTLEDDILRWSEKIAAGHSSTYKEATCRMHPLSAQRPLKP